MKNLDKNTCFPLFLALLLISTVLLQLLNPELSILDAIGCAAGCNDRFQVSITLAYEHDQTFEFEENISRSMFNELDLRGRKAARRLLSKARQALAVRMGYDMEIFGKGIEKYVNSKVMKIKISDNYRNTVKTVFSSDKSDL